MTMSPMLERLAAAMYEARCQWFTSGEPEPQLDVALALAALRALRQPTQFMVNAGGVARWPVGRESRTEEIWRTMIDAAELEKPD